MTLSEDRIDIIAENPLGDALESVRVKLRNCADVLSDGIVASLLGVLVTSSAAFNLPSPDESGNVAVKLFSIQQRVRGGSIKLDQFRRLVHHVIDKSADIEIWEDVFNIRHS